MYVPPAKRQSQHGIGSEPFLGRMEDGYPRKSSSKASFVQREMDAATFGDNWKRGELLDISIGNSLQASSDRYVEHILRESTAETRTGSPLAPMPRENMSGRKIPEFQTVSSNSDSCQCAETIPQTGSQFEIWQNQETWKESLQTYTFVVTINCEESQQTMFSRLEWIERSMYTGELAIQVFIVNTGKSHRAWQEAGEGAYCKDPRTKWWCGYRGQASVVIDEFRGGVDIAHILRWFDRYPVLVETKGASVPLACTRIWLTSNVDPRDWYPDLDEATRGALMRRLKITHFSVAR